MQFILAVGDKGMGHQEVRVALETGAERWLVSYVSMNFVRRIPYKQAGPNMERAQRTNEKHNQEPPRQVRLMLDSGAFTAWTKGEEINLKEYIQYIKTNSELIDTYFNLDVIPGKPNQPRTEKIVEEAAEASYKNLKRMVKAGLNPIPVFHQGEKFKWLERMVEDGHDYISLGGLGGQSEPESRMWLDKAWTRLTDTKGRPIRVNGKKLKVHGLGVSSFNLLKRYPWYTADATSWALTAAYGNIYVPVYAAGQPVYAETPVKISISKVERGNPPADHYLRMGPLQQGRVKDFLEKHVGTTPDKVADDYVERARAIVFFMLRFQEAIGKIRFKHRIMKVLTH